VRQDRAFYSSSVWDLLPAPFELGSVLEGELVPEDFLLQFHFESLSQVRPS
jgi:hypothetical protein